MSAYVIEATPHEMRGATLRKQERHEILAGRLTSPRRPASLLARPRLTDHLSAAQGVRVTTVVAPAGYGKSGLAADWSTTAHARGRRFGFVALEAADNDPMLFWTGVLAAARQLGAALDSGLVAVSPSTGFDSAANCGS
jgi:LuxR family maltose regulon positive regulatory protein